MIPDRKLLQQISRAECSSSREIDPYLDFFLALAICNTVVVSMATAQRQRVSTPFTVTVEVEMEGTVRRGKMDEGFVLLKLPVCKLIK